METIYARIIKAQNELTAIKTSHKYGLGTFKIWTAYRDSIGNSSGSLRPRYLVYEQVEDGGDTIPAITADANHLNIQIELGLSYTSSGKLQIYIFFYKRDYFLPDPPQTVRIWVRSTAELRFIREGTPEVG